MKSDNKLKCRVTADTEEFKEALIQTRVALEQFERALDRLENARISANIGPVTTDEE